MLNALEFIVCEPSNIAFGALLQLLVGAGLPNNASHHEDFVEDALHVELAATVESSKRQGLINLYLTNFAHDDFWLKEVDPTYLAELFANCFIQYFYFFLTDLIGWLVANIIFLQGALGERALPYNVLELIVETFMMIDAKAF